MRAFAFFVLVLPLACDASQTKSQEQPLHGLAVLVNPTANLVAAGGKHDTQGGKKTKSEPQNFGVKVLRQLPHVGTPFTQGLEFKQDTNELVETSGSFPPGTVSYVRGVNLQTGNTNWKVTDGLDGSFIEGIVQFGGPQGHWYASVYQEPRKTVEYDSAMNFISTHPYHFDGWGFSQTVDKSAFLATNGSSMIMTLKPGTFELVDQKRAMCLGRPVPGLNELEMVPNFLGRGPVLLGNVYTSRIVLALDPGTMECIGAFHLDGVANAEPIQANEVLGYHVANGIAYNANTDSLFVTGKNWNYMFEVKIEENAPSGPAGDALGQLDAWLGTTHTAPGILD